MDYQKKEDIKLMNYLEKLTRIITVNILFLITCLPIITIGVAMMSLINVLQNETATVGKKYLKSFQNNFKEGLRYGVLIEVVLSLLVFNYAALSSLSLARPLLIMLFSIMVVCSFLFLMVITLFSHIIVDIPRSMTEQFFQIFSIGFRNIRWTIILMLWTIINTVFCILSFFLIPLLSYYYVSVGFAVYGKVSSLCVRRIVI